MENNDITQRQFWDRNKTTMDMQKDIAEKYGWLTNEKMNNAKEEYSTFCNELHNKVLRQMKADLYKHDILDQKLILEDFNKRSGFQKREYAIFNGFINYVTPDPRDNRRPQERCSRKRLFDKSYPPKSNTYGSK